MMLNPWFAKICLRLSLGFYVRVNRHCFNCTGIKFMSLFIFHLRLFYMTIGHEYQKWRGSYFTLLKFVMKPLCGLLLAIALTGYQAIADGCNCIRAKAEHCILAVLSEKYKLWQNRWNSGSLEMCLQDFTCTTPLNLVCFGWAVCICIHLLVLPLFRSSRWLLIRLPSLQMPVEQ